jgi:hypothetical protein
MSLALTPEMLAHAYEYLCCSEPFIKFNMPPADDCKFLVIKTSDRFAHYQLVGDVHHIAVSTKFVDRHITLLSTMSHEMVHLHIRRSGIRQRHAHGRAFSKLADLVCSHHPEFDRLNF